MKVFLDDVRVPPPDWRLVRWPDEAIRLLQTGEVVALSLDHDLGDDERGTGYDVLVWLERVVVTESFVPPLRIVVHSSNVSARVKMELAIGTIKKYARRNATRALST